MRNALRHFGKLSASTIWRLPRNTIVLVIRGYQQTLSPDHGPMRHYFNHGYCRHTPTCSQYAIDQLERRGAVVGSLMAIGRVLTCHPWRQPDEKKVLETIDRVFPK